MAEYLKLTNDIVFQRIFGKVGNENITKAFLEKILGIKIEELTLDTNKRLIGEEIEDKIGRVDVKAKLQDGTKVIIEMQVTEYSYMVKRLLYYWSRVYVGDLKRGKEYDELNKTIAILISVENLEETKEIEKYHTEWELREKEHKELKLTEDIEIHIIELGKFKEGKEKRPEDIWIKALKAEGEKEMEELLKNNKELREMKEELERITADPELREKYYYREKQLRDELSRIKDGYMKGIKEGKKEGILEGKKEGIIEGKEEKEKEIVLNMHKNNMDIKTICNIVQITEEEVRKIIEEA